MRTCLLFLFFSLSFLTYSKLNAQPQYILLQDAKGNIVSEHTYSDIEGSPFFFTDWVNGNLTLDNNKVYKNLNLKYDEVKDKLYVKAENGDMVILNDKVVEFNFGLPLQENGGNKFFRSGYKNVPGTTVDSYFEVLADGKTQLLKRYTKIIQENKAYNSASSTKTFVENVKYYLLSNGYCTAVKKDKKSFLVVLSNKQTELEVYAKANNINFKDEKDLAKLITYYNSI